MNLIPRGLEASLLSQALLGEADCIKYEIFYGETLIGHLDLPPDFLLGPHACLVPRDGPGGACSYSISLKEECPHLQQRTKLEGAATSASTSASSSSSATPVPPPLCRFNVPPPGGPRRTVIRLNWKDLQYEVQVGEEVLLMVDGGLLRDAQRIVLHLRFAERVEGGRVERKKDEEGENGTGDTI